MGLEVKYAFPFCNGPVLMPAVPMDVQHSTCGTCIPWGFVGPSTFQL